MKKAPFLLPSRPPFGGLARARVRLSRFRRRSPRGPAGRDNKVADAPGTPLNVKPQNTRSIALVLKTSTIYWAILLTAPNELCILRSARNGTDARGGGWEFSLRSRGIFTPSGRAQPQHPNTFNTPARSECAASFFERLFETPRAPHERGKGTAG